MQYFKLGQVLAKHKDLRRLDSENGVNKPFEKVSCQGRIQNFFGRSNKCFFKLIFFGWVNFKQIEE